VTEFASKYYVKNLSSSMFTVVKDVAKFRHFSKHTHLNLNTIHTLRYNRFNTRPKQKGVELLKYPSTTQKAVNLCQLFLRIRSISIKGWSSFIRKITTKMQKFFL